MEMTHCKWYGIDCSKCDDEDGTPMCYEPDSEPEEDEINCDHCSYLLDCRVWPENRCENWNEEYKEL